MSGWWQATAQAPPGLLKQLFAPEREDGPATLLHLPSPLREGLAGVQSAVESPLASCRDEQWDGVSIGTAIDLLGFVKMWRSRSVDLRSFLTLTGKWTTLGEFPETPEDDQKGSFTGNKPPPVLPSKVDDLAMRLALVLQPPPDALLWASGPLEWPGAFYPYQVEGIQALVQSSHLLLGDEMGLGKTVQAIAALRLLLLRREIERSLVVVPSSLLQQWQNELARWAPELRVMLISGPSEQRLWQWQYRAHVSLVSYETVRSDCTNSSKSGPRREEWGVVVLDEAQKIKNRNADVSRACKRLPRIRSWAMTGTPLENSKEDLVSILEFVSPGEGRSLLAAPLPSLRATLSELQLRRRKEDVLQDLPEKITTELLLPLTESQRRAYDRAEGEGLVKLREGRDVGIEHVLALISRLKQICNFAPGDGASAKMEDLGGRLDELASAGHKALVFTQYTSEHSGARRIATGLAAFDPLLYTGDMEMGDRNRTIAQFQEEERHKVLILSLRVGGQGLNLQRASYVFHFDRWWNPAVERQAEDRTHRLGQTRTVNVYQYLMSGTIEQRIDEVLKCKSELFQNLVDGASMDLSRLLSKADLFGLWDLPARP